jgi:hypothetical protein
MLRLCTLVFGLITITSICFAECNFKTGQFIDELKDPSQIELLKIEIPKSAKYAKNFLKTVISKTHTIPKKLKKRFSASISVQYKFGECKYNGMIRQSGDFKDHIDYSQATRPIRSLNVQLTSGNILSSTNFKLLLPHTRNGAHEILASLILKKLGFISPETFEIETSVNGNIATTLFQENTRKEMLERNFRREGPMFEGDEELIWGYKKFKILELYPLALTRMINESWFLKGKSSEKISLSAFSKMQSSYLNQATPMLNINSHRWQDFAIDPNFNKFDIFPNYFFALLAMNGAHALAPNNRKYFYNTIDTRFEPIYYDGNVSFSKLDTRLHSSSSSYEKLLETAFSNPIDQKFVEQILLFLNSTSLKDDFYKRVGLLVEDKQKFYNESILIYKKNIRTLYKLISEKSFKSKVGDNNFSAKMNQYFELQKTKGLLQRIITKIEFSDEKFIAHFKSGIKQNLNKEQLAEIISKNSLSGERTLFLGTHHSKIDNKQYIKSTDFFPGQIISSPNIKIGLSIEDKTITFHQVDSYDWVLIKNADLSEWKVEFVGADRNPEYQKFSNQRFNEFGLTGCLTIFNSKLNQLKIEADGGACEDTLNIVSSSGYLNSIYITNASADAVDFDYSEIKLKTLNVNGAGNDCFDLSGGKYSINTMDLNLCGDKAISVGEASVLVSNFVNLKNSKIGVSSKDLSSVIIKKVRMEKVSTCLEAFQKKQEFGGAHLTIEELHCSGDIKTDVNSVILKGSE